MISKRRRKKAFHAFEISLTPLIDTLLVLLVILIVAAPVMHNSLKIALPKAKSTTQIDQAQTIPMIEIDHAGIIAFNSKIVSLDELIKQLELSIGPKEDQTVCIKADKNTSYEALVSVVDSIKYLAGVENVILSAERA